MKKRQIKIGYEIDEGNEVKIRLAHTVITGLTNESGKTTAIMGLIERSGLKAIIIKTKIGEKAITQGSLIPPFYKEDFDWEYASELLESSRKEKLKFERSWIIKYSRTANNLLEFKRNIDEALTNVKLRELEKSVLITLQAYLEKILPELQYAPLSKTLDIKEGINIMDLERFKEETQGLIIRSILNEVLNKEKNTIVIIPEAWKYLPEKLGSPVKRPAEAFIRQGATNNNFLFLDSMPGYEVILTKINGIIKPMSFKGLFNLEGETKKEGYHEIKKLKENVETLDSDNNRLRWYKLKKVFRHKYKGEILSINTLDGIIDVSPNHPVLKDVKSNQTVEAKNLKVGNILQSRRIEKKWRLHNNKELFVGTEDLAWLFGFYCAEGWVSGKHFNMSNNNKNLIEKAKKIIEKNFHYSVTVLSRKKPIPNKKGEYYKDNYTIDVNSPRLNNYFSEICYNSKNKFNCETKKVPDRIINAPINIKKAFIEGYMQGDGSKCKGYWNNVTSNSRILILGVIELMNAIDGRINYSIHIRDDKPNSLSIALNKSEIRKSIRNRIKKIKKKQYFGYLYDIEVDSPKHTFYMGIGNIRVHNSQDMTGVSKTILKQVSNWILGYQREVNEIKRTLDQIPLPKRNKPKPEDIATLKLGQFFVATSDFTKKVYAQPSWLDNKTAKNVAIGKVNIGDIEQPTYIAPYQIVTREQPLETDRDYGRPSQDIKKIINELRDDFISNRNDFFNKFQQINESISAIQGAIFKIRNENQKIDEDEIVMRILQKSPLQNNITTSINKEEIIKEILARVPKGQGNVIYEVAPLEKIKKDFLKEAKEKILSDTSSLSNNAKKTLKYLESQGHGCSTKEICTKGYMYPQSGGGYGKTVLDSVKELEGIQVAERDAKKVNTFGRLKERIKYLLENHEATEQEIEQVYNHIINDLI